MASKSKATKRRSPPAKRSALAEVDANTRKAKARKAELARRMETVLRSARVVKKPPAKPRPLTIAELQKLFPWRDWSAMAVEKDRLRQAEEETFNAYLALLNAQEKRVDAVRVAEAAKGRAIQALTELVDIAMHPNTVENYATARLGEVIDEAVADMTEIAESASPAATRARLALKELKRMFERPKERQAKARERDRTRGGKSPQARSKMLGDMVQSAIADMTMAHKQGEREFAGTALPEWSFAIARFEDAAVKPVAEAWMKAVESVVMDRLNNAGVFDVDKWTDSQKGHVRRHVRKDWTAEVERARKEHVDWLAQGMVT